MTPAEFDWLRRFLKERSGLVLADDKQYLIESRLLPVARRNGLASISDVAAKLKTQALALEAEVVEAMTTNESFFFRDKTPFEHLRDVMMPSLMLARGTSRRLRIWCAAASTGQEPYTIAMVLKAMAVRLGGWSVDILATDLSTEVLERAKSGLYTQFEVQRGLPIQLLMKHFEQRGDLWEIEPAIRSMVQFRSLNLLRDFSSLGTFDIVFCRNVLIYFDQPTKADVLGRIQRQVAADGFLVLGAAETVVGLTDRFRPHPEKRGLYCPSGEGRPAQTARLATASVTALRR
jgi:chemotaxis protein methyltransferase CheR